jgi:septal ring factor EnvC (AmiA/AmiB activator)
MKNWKDWALGILTTLTLAFGGIFYANLQSGINSIMIEQQNVAHQLKESYSQANVNQEEIKTLKIDVSNIKIQLVKNQDYTNAKFDIYDSNLREFYRSMKFKPVSQTLHNKESDSMYIDKKYYNSLYSMFDVPFDITVNP